ERRALDRRASNGVLERLASQPSAIGSLRVAHDLLSSGSCRGSHTTDRFLQRLAICDRLLRSPAKVTEHLEAQTLFACSVSSRKGILGERRKESDRSHCSSKHPSTKKHGSTAGALH